MAYTHEWKRTRDYVVFRRKFARRAPYYLLRTLGPRGGVGNTVRFRSHGAHGTPIHWDDDLGAVGTARLLEAVRDGHVPADYTPENGWLGWNYHGPAPEDAVHVHVTDGPDYWERHTNLGTPWRNVAERLFQEVQTTRYFALPDGLWVMAYRRDSVEVGHAEG